MLNHSLIDVGIKAADSAAVIFKDETTNSHRYTHTSTTWLHMLSSQCSRHDKWDGQRTLGICGCIWYPLLGWWQQADCFICLCIHFI